MTLPLIVLKIETADCFDRTVLVPTVLVQFMGGEESADRYCVGCEVPSQKFRLSYTGWIVDEAVRERGKHELYTDIMC